MDVRKKNKTLVYTVPVPWYTFSTKKMKNSPPSSPPSLPLPFAIIAPRPPTYVYYVRTILPTYITYVQSYLRTILILRTHYFTYVLSYSYVPLSLVRSIYVRTMLRTYVAYVLLSLRTYFLRHVPDT